MTLLADVFEPGRHLCDMAEIMFEEDFSVSLAVGWSFCPSCVSLGLCELVKCQLLIPGLSGLGCHSSLRQLVTLCPVSVLDLMLSR